LFSQLSVFQEIEQLLKEELTRVYTLLDNGKDAVLVDAVRLHHEKATLIARLGQTNRDLSYFRELRAKAGKIQKSSPHRAAIYEEAELLRRLAHEQETSNRLAAEVRELRLSKKQNANEADNRDLLHAKLEKQKLKLELHKLAEEVSQMQSKIKRINRGNDPNDEIQDLEEQIGALEAKYLAAVEWGYDQQAALFNEQAKSTVLEMQVNALQKGKEDLRFTIETGVLADMREKMTQYRTVEANYRWLKAAIEELLGSASGTTLEDGIEPAEMVEARRRAIQGGG
jgi:hypothetical protein